MKIKILCLCLMLVCLAGCRSERKNSATMMAKIINAAVNGAIVASQMHGGKKMRLDYSYKENTTIGLFLFQNQCEPCHETQKIGPPLLGRFNADPYNDSQINLVKYGVGDMPPFDPKLTSFQIRDILAYIRTMYEQKNAKDKE